MYILFPGKGILFDYLAQGTKERLTAPMIKCVMALGRRALVECLADHLDHLDDCIHAPRRNHLQTDLRETILVSQLFVFLLTEYFILNHFKVYVGKLCFGTNGLARLEWKDLILPLTCDSCGVAGIDWRQDGLLLGYSSIRLPHYSIKNMYC